MLLYPLIELIRLKLVAVIYDSNIATPIHFLHLMSDTTSENAFIETLAMRVREGLSSAEVARRMLMDRGNYSPIETGKTNPTSITLYRLSQITNCEVADFFK